MTVKGMEAAPELMRVFPNEQSCLRLISAILMETNDEWNMADFI